MATFVANVSTSTFGGGYPPPFDFVYGDFFGFELDFPDFYELFGGDVGYYSNGVPYGEIYNIDVYDYYGFLTREWNADGGIYDATAIFDLVAYGSWRDYFEYIFYLDDDIFGSQYNDKLAGYNGNDYLDGWTGNDKLKGGPGSDIFYFARFDGRDVIKDLSSSDVIWLDDSLASNFNDVFFAARKYKKGVILDFGSDEIKIPHLKLSQLDNVNFDFVI